VLPTFKKAMDLITYAHAKGIRIDILLTDYLKAFDQMGHNRRLAKLKAYAVKGKLKDWIADFQSSASYNG
jgi:hypothetical protein